jgi:hypothetical protein
MAGMRVFWLIFGPLAGWLLGTFISDAMFAINTYRSIESLAWKAALPGVCGLIGLLIVLLVRFRKSAR